MAMSNGRFFSIMVVPEDGRESHTFRVSYRTLKLAGGVALLLVVAVTLMAGSWWYRR